MIKLELYTGEKTYMFPNGKVATKGVVLEKYPAAEAFTFVVQTNESGEVMEGFFPLSTLRSRHGIAKELSDEEAVQAIEDIMNTPAPELEPEPDAQTAALEDIAAQLEYQNMMSLEDVESEV